MPSLARKTWRDLGRTRLRGLAVAAAACLWVTLYGGWLMGLESASRSFLSLWADLHVADLQVLLDPVEAGELPRLDDIPGVKVVQRRLCLRGRAELPGRGSVQLLAIFQDAFNAVPVNTLRLLEGRAFPDGGPTWGPARGAVDRTMASSLGLHVGDRLRVSLHGVGRELEVVGVVLSPELVFPTASPELITPSRGSLGVVYVPMQEVTAFLGHPMYNNLALALDGRHDRQTVEEQVRAALAGRRVHAFVPHSHSVDARAFRAILQGGRDFMPIVALVVGAVLAIIVLSHVHRLIQERRREIGVLLALGYSRARVVLHVTAGVTVFALAGSLVGLGLAFPFHLVFARNFLASVEFPEMVPAFLPALALQGALLCTVLCLAAAALAARWALSFAPCDALRGEAALARPLPGWLAPRDGEPGRSLVARYAFRSLLRRHRLTLATVLSVAFALALPASFNILATSIHGTMHDFYEADSWTLAVDFGTPLTPAEIARTVPAKLGGRREGYLHGMGVIEVGAARGLGQVVGVAPDSTMRKLELVTGRGFSSADAAEVILNRSLWKREPLAPGQKVRITTSHGAFEPSIVGLVDEVRLGLDYAYLPLGTAQRVLGETGRCSGLWLTPDVGADEAGRLLSGQPDVSAVTAKSEITATIDAYTATLKTSIRAVILMTVLMAPIFLATSVGLMVLERRRDFLVLQALGFHREVVLRVVMTECLAVGLASQVASVPLSLALGALLNTMNGRVFSATAWHVGLADFAFLLPATLLFPAVAWLSTRRIGRAGLAEGLQEGAR